MPSIPSLRSSGARGSSSFLPGRAGALTSGCFSAELAGCCSRPRAVFMLITLQVFPLHFRNQQGGGAEGEGRLGFLQLWGRTLEAFYVKEQGAMNRWRLFMLLLGIRSVLEQGTGSWAGTAFPQHRALCLLPAPDLVLR